MKLWHALVLGLVQGLGEFLPISSSGHLALAQHFMGLPSLEEMLPFDVLLHVATLIAVVVYFREDLRRILVAWVGSLRTVLRRGGWRALEADPDAKWAWLILLTMIPTGLVVVLLEPVSDFIDAHVITVPLLLMVAGTLNWYSDWRARRSDEGRRIEDMGVGDAVICGTAQGLAAVFHGMSRSGSTIAAGLSRGLNRDAAPRFSFLMLIPAVTAAALMEVPKLTASEVVGVPAMLLGFVTALVTGYLAVGATLRVVRRDRLRWFAVYCWLLGLVSLGIMLAVPATQMDPPPAVSAPR